MSLTEIRLPFHSTARSIEARAFCGFNCGNDWSKSFNLMLKSNHRGRFGGLVDELTPKLTGYTYNVLRRWRIGDPKRISLLFISPHSDTYRSSSASLAAD
ncbi:hypothetical protein L1987_54964 [Smallanthus sonchifolius]|uniref:Uncharacterized protein n=1 Tax=Smallanthus sonchifolius TaxID=185202 RepID=A0ACB9E884_9ASTR|nr:hypothetical protein L1987_54964 [Smallanthus sonchifolius]